MGSPAAADNNALHDLGYKIFLDRYALKDMTRKSLAIGDTVIVVVDSKTGQREVGTVTSLDLPTVTIKLLDGETVTRDLEHVDKPLETRPEQMMARVAAGIAEVEPTPEAQAEWSEKFRWLLDGWKFVPGGRILAGAGTDQQLTYYNCMPPEQEILTADGYRPLGDVQMGDLVVTHRNRLRRVLHRFERETEEPLYIVKTRKLGFDNLRLTGEHKVLAIRSEWVNKHRSRDGLRLAQEPQWIPAKDLRPGDYLAAAYDGEITATDTLHVFDYVGREDFEGRPAVGAYALDDGWVGKARVRPDGTKMTGKPTLAVRDALVIDTELMELFGRWLGDGCVTHRTGTDIPSGIKIVFGLDEQAEAEHIARIVEDKLGVPAAIKLSSTKRWLDLWVNAMPVGEFFANLFGKYSYGKRIPTELMRQPDYLVKALLRGLFQADGYTSHTNIGMALSNKMLATQVHQLLLRLGYFFAIYENTHKLGRVPAYRISSAVSEAGELFTAFFDRPAPSLSMSVRTHIEHDGLKWARIEEIDTETYTGTVLDIEVDEDHSFVSAGVVVSNCYVIASPKDSRGGIMETLGQMTEIMSRGGGVGINISTLRPRHAYVKGVNGRSSGAVSWGALYSFVTGLIEQGGCFGPNERIATDKGLIPAAELADRMDAGEIFHAHTHKGLRRITMRFRNGVKPLYEVRTERGYTVRITKEHKVAVLRGGDVTTIPLAELEPGDEILLLLGGGSNVPYVPLKPVVYDRSVMSTTLNENVTLPAELTEDIAYFLGYLHADGYVQVGKKVTWTAPKALKLATADAHPEIRARLDEIVTRVFGLKVNHENGDGALVNLAIYSRLLIEWLNQNGLLKSKAASVRVPEAIFRSPSSVMGAFIAGYFDADGCNRGRKGGYGIDSISRGVLEDIQQLLSVNGIVSRIHTTPRDHLGWQTIYQLNVVGAQFKAKFAAFVPAEKIADDGSRRDMYNTYPADVWSSLGARSKYRQRIHDGVSQRISHGQLTAIQGRLTAAGEVALAERLTERMNTIPDVISSILPLGDSEVYDFEVEDVHLLSGSGVYTSNSRRGALMLILNDWHPDVFTFINSKRQAGQITNANISVGVSDKLMDAVKADGTWDLMFPDTSDPAYDTEWNGDLDKWIADGRKAHVYKTVKAREVWDAIIESAWASAEPGVWFRERSNKMANSWYFNPLISTNPCGEQPLGAFSVCNLGAINLAKLYDAENHDVAWDDLANTVRYAVRFLDDVIDSTPYFFEENARVQGMERRVGLGTMGIAELMIRLKIRYGSAESEDFIDRLYKFIAVNAYDESVEIAKVKGPFSAFDADKFLQSGFIKTLPDDLRKKIRAHGVRNVTLLTQAPTGTTGTLVNTSTGIEPFFSWVYYRKSRLGLHEEHVPIVQEWLDANPGKTEKDLPDYFATAMDLTPEEHVRVQAAFQRWIDSAISKTCNVPNEYSIEQVSELYMLMYDLGCKGGTIYRDGSRSEQVLMLKGDERAESEMKDKEKSLQAEVAKAEAASAPVASAEPVAQPVATPHRVYPRPAKLFGVTVKVATPFGTAYVNMNVDENSNPFEVFVTAPGKAGSDLQADAEGIGRLITLSLRSTPPHNRREMLRLIIEQLRDIGGSRTAGFGPNRVMSLPDAVARALEDHFFHVPTPAQLSLPLGDAPSVAPLAAPSSAAPLILPDGDSELEPDAAPVLEFEQSAEGAQPKGFVNGHRVMGADMCPSCHTISLVRAEGCRKCLTCGYSEC